MENEKGVRGGAGFLRGAKSFGSPKIAPGFFLRAGLAAYQALLGAVVLFRWISSGMRSPSIKDRTRSRTWRACRSSEASSRRLLLHGVSVGEAHLLAPLARELSRSKAPFDLFASSSTQTGFDRAREVFGEKVQVMRFPLDFGWAVRRFLTEARPDAVVLAESELWPVFLSECADRGIPVCVASGRISDRAWRLHRRFAPWTSSVFPLTGAGAASEEDGRRFAALGVAADKVRVTGSLKWSAARPSAVDRALGKHVARFLGVDPNRPLLVAGSTGPGEERALIDRLPKRWQLILAPRSPERWDRVARLLPGMPRRSRARDPAAPRPDRRPVFLLDAIGELKAAYAVADAAFVGRSLRGMGGSNPLEPVLQGKVTLIGPGYENFRGIVQELLCADAIIVSEDPMGALEEIWKDPARVRELQSNARMLRTRSKGVARATARLVKEVALKEPRDSRWLHIQDAGAATMHDS